MSFRFRLGPFTFGRTGARLSPWRRQTGVSIPLSGKGRSFGKIRFGPFSWYLNGWTVVGLLLVGAIVSVFLLAG